MKTQAQFETMRKIHTVRLKALMRNLSEGEASPELRAVRISCARVYHQVRNVAKHFNQACRTQGTGYWPTPTSIVRAIENKYTATALAILELISAQNIPIDRWMLAQVETLRKMPQSITLYHCFGVKALERYIGWEARQKRTYKGASDRNQQTKSVERKITRAIVVSHRQALGWVSTVKDAGAPNLAAALLFIFPHINAWYCVAYKTFRDLVMETGYCTEPHLLACWKKYKNSKTIQDVCEEALMSVTEKHGALGL